MLASMESYFPPGVSWSHPQGGLFLWVTPPEHVDTIEFPKVALEEKVAFLCLASLSVLPVVVTTICDSAFPMSHRR